MIYITGDIHSGIDIRCLNSHRFPEGKSLCRQDYVIVTGDFGLPWINDKEDRYWLNWLHDQPYTLLFVDGNHENYDLLKIFPQTEWKGGRVGILRENILHLQRGQVFDLDGIRLFTFGGAMSHDKAYRKEGVSWWKLELPNQEEYDEGRRNLEAHNWKVDLVITHTAPRQYIPALLHAPYEENEETELHDYLQEIEDCLEFNAWYFGHFHQDAAINNKMNVMYNTVRKYDAL